MCLLCLSDLSNHQLLFFLPALLPLPFLLSCLRELFSLYLPSSLFLFFFFSPLFHILCLPSHQPPDAGARALPLCQFGHGYQITPSCPPATRDTNQPRQLPSSLRSFPPPPPRKKSYLDRPKSLFLSGSFPFQKQLNTAPLRAFPSLLPLPQLRAWPELTFLFSSPPQTPSFGPPFFFFFLRSASFR